jgi:imidazolonepropionase-like amidohydrolase
VTPTILIRGARVVDARGPQPSGTDILVDGGRIVAVGDALPANDATIVIDGDGLTACPGLMNAHVHLSLDASADPEASLHGESDVVTAVRAARRLAEVLARGVTSVRDLGGPEAVTLGLARLVAAGELIGPRIVAAGRVVTMTGGHGHWMGIEVDGPDAARRATRLLLKAGAGVVKVMATGGMMTTGQVAGAPQLTVEEMSACVEEAHKAGRKVAAHAEGREGARNAVEAGVDSIEHGHGTDEATLTLMAERGIALVPTIACDRAIVNAGTAAGIPAHVVEDCARLAPDLERVVRRAIALGVPIAAGNDGGAPLTHPGDIVDELEVYVELGMDPLAALTSATTATADLFGLRGVGLLEPGAAADLLLVDGDPLTSISHLRNPVHVIAAGTLVH